jgi:hypothetical protein
MNVLVIIIGLVIIIYILYRYTPIFETFSEHDKNPPRELSPFINFDLYDKPYANHAPDYIYQWWKYGLEPNKYYSCNQYRCQTPYLNQVNACPCFNLVNNKYVDPNMTKQPFHETCGSQKCHYYADAASYCAAHPEDQRCPNYRPHV